MSSKRLPGLTLGLEQIVTWAVMKEMAHQAQQENITLVVLGVLKDR